MLKVTRINNSAICGPQFVGKWYASDYELGSDGWSVHRYLQHDGSWGNTTQYFDDEQTLRQALEAGRVKGYRPDFTLSRQELEDRAMTRQDMEDFFHDALFGAFD